MSAVAARVSFGSTLTSLLRGLAEGLYRPQAQLRLREPLACCGLLAGPSSRVSCQPIRIATVSRACLDPEAMLAFESSRRPTIGGTGVPSLPSAQKCAGSALEFMLGSRRYVGSH